MKKQRMKPWILPTAALAVMPLAGVLLTFAAPRIAQELERPRAIKRPKTTNCEERFAAIGEAFIRYQDEHAAFPPAYTTDEQGNRLHSWRTLILPYLGYGDLYSQIDLTKPWDHPLNEKLAEQIPEIYQCVSSELPPRMTKIVSVVDPEGVMRGIIPIQRSQISDEIESTIMLVEANTSNAVHWMSPYDLNSASYINGSPDPTSSSEHAGRHYVLLADGSVFFMRQTISPEIRAAFLTINGRENQLSMMVEAGMQIDSSRSYSFSYPYRSATRRSTGYSIGVATLRKNTSATGSTNLDGLLSSFRSGVKDGDAEAALQLANLSSTQAEQYAWLAVAAQMDVNLRGSLQAFRNLIGDTSKYESLAAEYIKTNGLRDRPQSPVAKRPVTNQPKLVNYDAAECVRKGDAELARGHQDPRLLSTTTRWYEMALERQPNNASAFRGLGEIEGRLGNLDGAADFYRKAIKQAPNSVRILNSFAWTIVSCGNSETDPALIKEATEAAERAYKKSPEDPSLQNTLGVCLYRSGKWKEALELLQSSLKKADVIHNWLFLAMTHWQLGEKAEAHAFMTKSQSWKLKGTLDTEVKRFFAEAETLMASPDDDSVRDTAESDENLPNTTTAQQSQVPLLLSRATQGDVSAMASLGHLFRSGEDVEQDLEEAFKWDLKAAQAGRASSQAVVGHSYRTGKGVEQDFKKAHQWDLKAAKQGVATAQSVVGHSLFNSKVIDQNLIESYAWLTLAAEAGIAKSVSSRPNVLSKLSDDDRVRAIELTEEYRSLYTK